MQAMASDAGIAAPSFDRSCIDSPALSTTSSSPTLLGEIPCRLTQEKVDAGEKKLQNARDFATKVGV